MVPAPFSPFASILGMWFWSPGADRVTGSRALPGPGCPEPSLLSTSGSESSEAGSTKETSPSYQPPAGPQHVGGGIIKEGPVPRWAFNKQVQIRENRPMELCRGGTTLTHRLFTQKLFCCANKHQEDHLLIRFLPSRHSQSIKCGKQKREQKRENESALWHSRSCFVCMPGRNSSFCLARQGTSPCVWATNMNKSSSPC